jgi:hypothetical protein
MSYKLVDVYLESVWDYVEIIRANDDVVLGYYVLESIAFFSKRYNKTVVVERGDMSDGATCAPDLDSFGWLFHDELCATGLFEDGTPCNNLQASAILGDIMAKEGKWFRRNTWFIGTWLFGGGKARENGMF